MPSLALRTHPVLPCNSRVAATDTVLPVGGGTDGLSPIFVAKGTMIAYHVSALHRRKDLWGPDADEYRPERWVDEKFSWVRTFSSHFSESLGLRSNCSGGNERGNDKYDDTDGQSCRISCPSTGVHEPVSDVRAPVFFTNLS